MNPLSWLKRLFAAPTAPTLPTRQPAATGAATVAAPAQPEPLVHDDADPELIADAPLQESAPLINERRVKPRTSAREGTRALIIDDSPTIVAMLRKMLKQNGYQTLEAGSAEEGLEIARTLAPEIVFLDIVLPEMDGFAALRQLRRDPTTRHLPVIMISGNEQAVEQFYVQRIGADDFMKKPFSRAELFARIEPLLDEARIPRRRTVLAG